MSIYVSNRLVDIGLSDIVLVCFSEHQKVLNSIKATYRRRNIRGGRNNVLQRVDYEVNDG